MGARGSVRAGALVRARAAVRPCRLAALLLALALAPAAGETATASMPDWASFTKTGSYTFAVSIPEPNYVVTAIAADVSFKGNFDGDGIKIEFVGPFPVPRCKNEEDEFLIFKLADGTELGRSGDYGDHGAACVPRCDRERSGTLAIPPSALVGGSLTIKTEVTEDVYNIDISLLPPFWCTEGEYKLRMGLHVTYCVVRPEACDGADNDCDGVADDGFGADVCSFVCQGRGGTFVEGEGATRCCGDGADDSWCLGAAGRCEGGRWQAGPCPACALCNAGTGACDDACGSDAAGCATGSESWCSACANGRAGGAWIPSGPNLVLNPGFDADAGEAGGSDAWARTCPLTALGVDWSSCGRWEGLSLGGVRGSGGESYAGLSAFTFVKPGGQRFVSQSFIDSSGLLGWSRTCPLAAQAPAEERCLALGREELDARFWESAAPLVGTLYAEHPEAEAEGQDGPDGGEDEGNGYEVADASYGESASVLEAVGRRCPAPSQGADWGRCEAWKDSDLRTLRGAGGEAYVAQGEAVYNASGVQTLRQLVVSASGYEGWTRTCPVLSQGVAWRGCGGWLALDLSDLMGRGGEAYGGYDAVTLEVGGQEHLFETFVGSDGRIAWRRACPVRLEGLKLGACGGWERLDLGRLRGRGGESYAALSSFTFTGQDGRGYLVQTAVSGTGRTRSVSPRGWTASRATEWGVPGWTAADGATNDGVVEAASLGADHQSAAKLFGDMPEGGAPERAAIQLGQVLPPLAVGTPHRLSAWVYIDTSSAGAEGPAPTLIVQRAGCDAGDPEGADCYAHDADSGAGYTNGGAVSSPLDASRLGVWQRVELGFVPRHEREQLVVRAFGDWRVYVDDASLSAEPMCCAAEAGFRDWCHPLARCLGGEARLPCGDCFRCSGGACSMACGDVRASCEGGTRAWCLACADGGAGGVWSAESGMCCAPEEGFHDWSSPSGCCRSSSSLPTLPSLLVRGPLVGEFDVSPRGDVATSPVLADGEHYQFVVSGTWSFEASFRGMDALYYFQDRKVFPVRDIVPPERFPLWGWIGLVIDEEWMRAEPDGYDASHVYSIPYTGKGRAATFRVNDTPGYYYDNTGLLHVQVYRMLAPEPPAGLWNPRGSSGWCIRCRSQDADADMSSCACVGAAWDGRCCGDDADDGTDADLDGDLVDLWCGGAGYCEFGSWRPGGQGAALCDQCIGDPGECFLRTSDPFSGECAANGLDLCVDHFSSCLGSPVLGRYLLNSSLLFIECVEAPETCEAVIRLWEAYGRALCEPASVPPAALAMCAPEACLSPERAVDSVMGLEPEVAVSYARVMRQGLPELARNSTGLRFTERRLEALFELQANYSRASRELLSLESTLADRGIALPEPLSEPVRRHALACGVVAAHQALACGNLTAAAALLRAGTAELEGLLARLRRVRNLEALAGRDVAASIVEDLSAGPVDRDALIARGQAAKLMVDHAIAVLDLDELRPAQQALASVVERALASEECALSKALDPSVACDDALDLAGARAALASTAESMPRIAISLSEPSEHAQDERDLCAVARFLRRDPASFASSVRAAASVAVVPAGVDVRVPGGAHYSWALYTVNVTANASAERLVLPVRIPKAAARMAYEAHFDRPVTILEMDPLVLWEVGRVKASESVELHYTVKKRLCRTRAECLGEGELCDNANPIGTCGRECNGCGTPCDTGSPGGEVCDGAGRCIPDGERLAIGSPCACDGMCASSNCAIGICCGEGEFADPASLSCSREPVALVLPVATAELDLDQAFELPVRIVNPLDTVQTFRLAATGGASLSVPPGPFVVLPGESAATRISVAGARLGSTTFLVEAANELGTLRTQRAVTLVSSSSASPLGVQVRTAPDVGAAQALALALAAGALVLARRRTPRSPVRG